jgi:uncharacterized protein YukE
MAWYKPKDIIKNVTDFLGGGGATTEQSATVSVPGRDADSSKIWSDFMSQYGNLSSNLTNQTNYNQNAFNKYINSINNSNNEYQGTISQLMSGLNNDANKISFGMEGSSPVDFTSRQDRSTAGMLSDLASNLLTSKSTVPTATYTAAKENNPYSTQLKLYDILSDLAKQSEDRRYKTPTTTTTTADTSESGLLDLLTSLGELGSSTSGLMSLGSSSGSSGAGTAAASTGVLDSLGGGL